MAVNAPEDFQSLRRRVERLEAVLAAIMTAELPRSSRDRDLYIDMFLNRPEQSPESRQFQSLLDQYHYGREEVFHEVFERLNKLDRVQRELGGKLDQVRREFRDRQEELSRKIDALDAQTKSSSAELHRWLSIQSLDLATKGVRLDRFVPMRVYLSDIPDSGLDPVTEAIDRLIEAFGFEVSDDFPEVLGSWFKKWFVKTKEVASQPEVAERLAKVERALELKGLGSPQADIDQKQASAVAALTSSLEKVPAAAMQVGSILYLKQTIDGQTVIQVRTLTQRELLILENNQDLLNSPTTVMTKLAQMCARDAITNGVATAPVPITNPSDIWLGLKPSSPPVDAPQPDARAVPRLPYIGNVPAADDQNDKGQPG
jgi:hypothetical protein